jgi:hypothetical protein
MMQRKLPEALTMSQDFLEVTTRQKAGFESNLAYIDGIAKDIVGWLANEHPDVAPNHFFDELELDVTTVLSLPDSDKGVSAWLIHSTWTKDFGVQSLVHQLSPDLVRAINSSLPAIEGAHHEYKIWLTGQGEALTNCLDLFYCATTRESAVAYFIAIDAILANILAGAIRFRLAFK